MKKPSISTFSFVIVIIALLIFGQVGTQVHAQSPRLAPGLVATQPPSASSPGPQELMDAPSWVDGIPWYSYVADFMGNYPVQGVGTFVGYWQNADEGLPAVNLVYYIHVVAYGINSPQWGTQSAYMTFQLPPNTILAISSTNPMYCYGGPFPLEPFTCDFTLQQLAPGQYAIPSGDPGNVWPVAAGWGWEFQIPVVTSTTLNNSQLTGAFHIIDGYGSPWLYPYVAIYVWPVAVPGAFNKSGPSNGATGVSTSPTLSWAGSTGATKYEYCYNTTNSCSTWVNNGTATTKALSGLSANITYYWHVRAVNSGGATYSNGSNTAWWSFKTAAPGEIKQIYLPVLQKK